MLASWKKSCDQPRQHIKKHKHYFANIGLSSQGYVFPVVMYGRESWTIKKAECQRIDAFELWCWRRLLRVPWTARRSNQSIWTDSGNQSWIFIGRTDAEAKTPILWPPDVKNWLIGKDPEKLKAGEGDDRGWDGWMALPTQWTWVWVNSRTWSWTGRPGMLQSMGSQRVRHDWATELNWCWERLKAGEEGDDRGWDGWMASPTQWTWVWVNSRTWWWTGRPGVLQSMRLQRVGHDWATELNWDSLKVEELVSDTFWKTWGLESVVSKLS